MRYSSIYKVMALCYNYFAKHTQRIVNCNIFINIVRMKVKQMTDVFSIQDFKFPTNFLWGSAVAGHQVEGNNIHSNNWYNEQQTLKVNPSYEVSGMACNHYNMYREDVLLLKELGHRAFRLSIEWARIEPEEGRFLQTELDHYIKELAFLKENGIQTFVTMVHFSVPLWFAKKGDFSNLENIKYFERFLNYVVPKISRYVDFWNVLNEFNLGSTQQKLDFKFNSVFFHARGYHIIKQYSDKPISSAHALVQYYGRRQNDVFDVTMQHYNDIINHEFFFHAMRTGELVLPHKDGVFDKELKNTVDFWSVNLYTRDIVDSRKKDFRGERYDFTKTRMLPMNFYLDEFYPECVYHNLNRLLDKPVYITENGCSCNDDDFRIVYLAEYLSAMNEAIRSGVDLRGYLYWSFLDNYEWSTYIPKFGLVEVDYENNFKRTPKPSAYFYKEIIENNGFSQKILKKYLKNMPRVDTSLPIII